jgi:glycosylphosphatidylinositol transamidase (GPIT) subunit GPI8
MDRIDFTGDEGDNLPIYYTGHEGGDFLTMRKN